jgi:predicted lysophospholipase L1 biosynthesis ABC-type transport system permease subunit
VIVNRSFVERVMGGRNPIGRYVRYLHHAEWRDPRAADSQPWYEIVGVVPDLGMGAEPEGLYHPTTAGAASPLYMAVHARGDPAALAPKVRGLASEVDPTLQLHQLAPLDEVNQDEASRLLVWLIVLVSGVALLLSLAGIYAVMAFTVTQRTREIGIRVALGAGALRVVTAIFVRPIRQVAVGIVAGTLLVAAFPLVVATATPSAAGALVVLAYAACMLAVCMTACIVPTRRALGIEPTEALRAD